MVPGRPFCCLNILQYLGTYICCLLEEFRCIKPTYFHFRCSNEDDDNPGGILSC